MWLQFKSPSVTRPWRLRTHTKHPWWVVPASSASVCVCVCVHGWLLGRLNTHQLCSPQTAFGASGAVAPEVGPGDSVMDFGGLRSHPMAVLVLLIWG